MDHDSLYYFVHFDDSHSSARGYVLGFLLCPQRLIGSRRKMAVDHGGGSATVTPPQAERQPQKNKEEATSHVEEVAWVVPPAILVLQYR